MQMVDAAEQALRELGSPSHLRDIHAHILQKGYFAFGARDPLRALGVCLDRRSRGVPISRSCGAKLFYRHAPATYGLLEWLDDPKQIESLDLEEQVAVDLAEELDTELFLEQDWQNWIYNNLAENGLTALGFGPLRLYDPAQQERKKGRYACGEIDFLLVDTKGNLVVIELKRRGDDQTVGQVCRYVGWVKEHIAGTENDVRGVILAQNVSDQLAYALLALM